MGVDVGEALGETSGLILGLKEGEGLRLGVILTDSVGVGVTVNVGVALGVAVCAICDPDGNIEKTLVITELIPASFCMVKTAS